MGSQRALVCTARHTRDVSGLYTDADALFEIENVLKACGTICTIVSGPWFYQCRSAFPIDHREFTWHTTTPT